MHTTIRTAAFVLLACVLSSCTSARECAPEDAYRIDYFTGGGFTGFEHGTTIECSGRVLRWERKPGSERKTIDSLLLSSKDRTTFDKLMNDPALFAYAKQEPGNVTTTLIVSRGGKKTQLAYPSSAPPADLPAAVRTLIAEITSIHK